MAATEYIVLRQDEDPEHWTYATTTTAASSSEALRESAVRFGDGTFVAIPSRSWQPAAFKVQPRAVAVKETS